MLGVQWRNSTALSKYPFAHTSNCKITPCLLDLRVFSPLADETLYVSAVSVVGRTATFVFSTATRLVGQAAIPASGGTHSITRDGQVIGVIVSSETVLAQLFEDGDQALEFSPEDTRICVACIVPVPDTGVTSVTLDNTVHAPTLRVQAKTGVQFTVVEHPDVVDVRVDALGGTDYRDDLCADTSIGIPTTPIRTINNIPPDADGCWNFYACPSASLNARELLRIRPSGNSVLIYMVERS